MSVHTPVMPTQVIQVLDIRPDSTVIDCTLGEGGHASLFLRIIREGKLFGIEQDADILEVARERLKEYGDRFVPVHGNFSDVGEIVRDRVHSKADGIFFDLGISMYHIKESGRGFSFSREEPLDMRLDPSRGISAADVINGFSRKKLSEIIWAYGEERFSGRIALSIVEERKKNPVTTSTQLADIVKRAVPRKFWPHRIHPATKTFQAIRIFVNDEIEILENALRDAVEVLKPGGRICVISFHSLEDRIVKSVFNDLGKGCHCPPDFPVCVCGGKKVVRVLTRKPSQPDEEDALRNPASRSARLRCAVKLNGTIQKNKKEEMRYSA